MKRLFLLLTAAFGLCTTLPAQEALLSPIDAKSLGMGGLSMGLTNLSHSIYTNSAMTAFSLHNTQTSASYMSLADENAYAITSNARIGERNFLLTGWRQYLHQAGSQDKAFDAGYTRRFAGNWAVGGVLRYSRLKRADDTADALAVDLSAAWACPLPNVGSFSSIRVGAKLANIGGYFGHSEYALPVSLTAGAVMETFLTDAHVLTGGIDLGYCFNPSGVRGFQMSVGAEYNLTQLIQFRAGYHYGGSDALPSYTTIGTGVRFLHLRLDFAYLFAKKNTLFHDTYTLSFGLDF